MGEELPWTVGAEDGCPDGFHSNLDKRQLVVAVMEGCSMCNTLHNFHTTLIVVHICAVRFTAKLRWVALFTISNTQTTRYCT